MANFEIRRLAGALGAEVLGIDLGRPLPASTVDALRAAWLEQMVLFFRDQVLDPDRYMAFARSFGRPIEYPFVRGIEGYPQLSEVKKLEHERTNGGGISHSDTAYLDVPPMASKRSPGSWASP